MSQKYDKLNTLLKELFQLDQSDLDFGLYRVMHAKSAEVSQFLDDDLLPQVQVAFDQYRTADKVEIEKRLATAIEQAQGLGVDPETTQKVKDLRALLQNNAVDIGALENEVYVMTTYSASFVATTPRATSSLNAYTSRASTPSPTRAKRSRSTGPTRTSTTSRRANTCGTTPSA